MNSWIFFAIMALIIYGFWGFFPKLAVTYIDPMSALVFEVAGAILVGFVVLALTGFAPQTHPRGVLFAMLTGITGMAGTLCLFAAASKERISLVSSLTAVYPLITILLAIIFLKESLSLKNILGIFFAMLAIFLLSS